MNKLSGKMRSTLVLALSAATLSGMVGCKKNNPAPSNSANVMFVNGCPGTLPGIDTKLDNINVSGALNIAFGNNSGYKNVKAGTAVTIAYFITNSGTPVISNAVDITKDLNYTAFCGGIITAPKFVFVQDDKTAPANNTAKIRFVNLSSDAMSVTANVQNIVIDSGVTSLEVTPYMSVTAGTYDLKAGDPSNINTVVTIGSAQTLAAGKIYTLMLTGTVAGTGVSALKLTLINNN